jgi:hypothetical protein
LNRLRTPPMAAWPAPRVHLDGWLSPRRDRGALARTMYSALIVTPHDTSAARLSLSRTPSAT